ncbi:MAG: EAL domain-containing protein [Oscillospiraceae bacterium]|nr:EAL domain-containing protein [Oscillospiraceae bacterium]
MNETEITAEFDRACREGQLSVRYQPQYNHSTGRMTGAEALMRWEHPEHGTQYPADFIPVLERHGLIRRADLYVFEQVCAFQRKCLDEGVSPVPVSVNISRHDILEGGYVSELERIRRRYDVPVRLLRTEITESSAVGGLKLVSTVLRELHEAGYVVEMDDFGSGYSSLNILKDLDVDIIKLDMNFLTGDVGGRGGTIINAMVQMAKWLDTPTIAEGVETVEQADYMKSIGCNYIQGYVYSRPLPGAELLELLRRTGLEPTSPAMRLLQPMDAEKFWNPESLETLIFSNYVGAAAIFSYEDGRAEILRVNVKYIKELGMNITEEDVIRSDPWESFDPENRKIYEDTLRRAIASGEEESCETWRTFVSRCCGEDRICIRSHIRVIGKAGQQSIVYAMVQNVTAEKQRYTELADSERRFRFASEQANVYAWEYTIGTKQMRPCFRCMRDLGLPALLENYPEPVIENGIFPADYADMYRDWHRQLEKGAEHLEAVIPLTVGRVPFHVRYTTEFDENGRPLKAYGSATLVVDEPEKAE